MYTKLAFVSHLEEGNDLHTMELPEIVPASEETGRPEKSLFHELQVSNYVLVIFSASIMVVITLPRYSRDCGYLKILQQFTATSLRSYTYIVCGRCSSPIG